MRKLVWNQWGEDDCQATMTFQSQLNNGGMGWSSGPEESVSVYL